MKIRAIPFGYKYDVGQIVVDETAACVVKEIFKQYINGNSLLNISSLLNNMNIEYRPGVVGWNKARIKRIIEDKRYLGNLSNERRHTIYIKVRSNKALRRLAC